MSDGSIPLHLRSFLCFRSLFISVINSELMCIKLYVHSCAYSGRRHGQIYSYPAQRWKKKSSLPLPDIPLPRAKSADAEIPESGDVMLLNIRQDEH